MKKFLTILIVFFTIFLCGCSNSDETSSSDGFWTKLHKKCVKMGFCDDNRTALEKIKERNKFIIGVKFDAKPFGFVENKELKGFDIDIAKYITEDILDDENNVEFVEVTSENRISKLINEDVDMVIATMTKNEERELIVDFSDPYYISGQAVMCKKNSRVKSIADLSDNKTAVVIGTTAEKTLRNSYHKSQVLRYPTYKEAFNAVKNSNDTCVIADEPLLQGFIMDNNGYQIFNKKLTTEQYAIAIRKNEEDLKKAINYSLYSMGQSGELDKLNKKWIK